ncbi:glycosyltransferase family 4 protein [Xanthomonas phaseoli]|uniref:Glycosyl transferase n=1 Tax=Xanthomonas phaseoli pv. dieffenbachiae TaxID=92828 RepID=A0A1V9GZ73_9XANT|nr:glycosyltransferase family 4 protein [Xanthomonas phaseoli]MBO9788098.1 glycosyltransferase family 4 protein [Xanthomonas phaseoli pv. dieffenbachiae]MBO9885792.1 glycosyltransferase family 4 protein [Xanthomonas phaseoli pv. dieffenbachiae]MBO9915485.1 glycosyltransferase family 4 protein [Xanthomonas phaseoli pv. dieffenbachiae]MBO9937896.1 glycosyltransferase family 4 protein [Xanthomonas phaseoli pv. dieffenbachiae]MBO9994217.1 glycosyltransferase family 4 protein [Xanthomonas phaseoli 
MSLHVAHLNLVPTPDGLSAEQVFAQWPSLADIAEAVASAGVQVSVIQASALDIRLRRAGVDYRFADLHQRGSAVRARTLAALLHEIAADVLHVHGLEFAGDARRLARLLPQLPILLQDHANRPPRWWARRVWRARYAAAAGIAFTSLELAQPFVRARLFGRSTQLFAIPESSSRFTAGDRLQAREQTRVHGDPCVVWIGHFSPAKDPLCVLDAVAMAARLLPGLRLWCVFDQAPLLAQVQQRLRADPRLAGCVHLLGKVEHGRVQELLRAADVFVSASHAESCGYAALEAYACGCLPLLTAIPSFRALSDDGAVGELWPVGDASALSELLLRVSRQRPSRALVRAHFDARLSFAAVGRRWAQAYAQLRTTQPECTA